MQKMRVEGGGVTASVGTPPHSSLLPQSSPCFSARSEPNCPGGDGCFHPDFLAGREKIERAANVSTGERH